MQGPGVIEIDPKQSFGRLVVIEQGALLIHHPHRDRQIAGGLPEQDHLDWLLSHDAKLAVAGRPAP